MVTDETEYEEMQVLILPLPPFDCVALGKPNDPLGHGFLIFKRRGRNEIGFSSTLVICMPLS